MRHRITAAPCPCPIQVFKPFHYRCDDCREVSRCTCEAPCEEVAWVYSIFKLKVPAASVLCLNMPQYLLLHSTKLLGSHRCAHWMQDTGTMDAVAKIAAHQ